MSTRSAGVYKKLNVSPVINLWGHVSTLGGFVPTPAVQAAMSQANEQHVDMVELLDAAGEHIADALGVEAAYVAPGGIASLVLSSAAVMTRDDLEKIMHVPDTTGMRNEFVVQANSDGAERAYELAGGRLVVSGDEQGCTPAQLEAAIGPATAAVTYYFNPDRKAPMLTLEETAKVARSCGVLLIVDAATSSRPLNQFRRLARSGDLVSFGGKYFGGPSASGFVCGRKDLIEHVASLGCYTGEGLGDFMPFGRPLKMDRMQVVGLLVALDEWLSTDHEQRLADEAIRLSAIADQVADLPGVTTELVRSDEGYDDLVLNVKLGAAVPASPSQVVEALDRGSPSIKVRVPAVTHDTIPIYPHSMQEGEETIVAERLRAALTG